MFYFMTFVALSFVFMHTLELIASHARFAGKILGKNATGYSVQNATFTLTRFLNILLMPILGYLIDVGVNVQDYLLMVTTSLFGAGVMGGVVFYFRRNIVCYYINVIKLFNSGKGLLSSIFNAFNRNKKIEETFFTYKIQPRFFILGLLIYTLYSIGVFSSYLAALKYPDYRLSISQMSGVVNALATILLTIKLDPMLSRVFDAPNSDGSEFFSILLGRIFGVLFLSPTLFFIFYLIV